MLDSPADRRPATLRSRIDTDTYADQSETLRDLIAFAGLDSADRAAIVDRATDLVRDIRASTGPGLMEVFLAEYGLSTDEGVALMCLAEALLRVPDADTIDALIEDKIAPSDWGRHLGHSTSPLVNASTWALMLTGRVLADDQPGPVGHLRAAIKRLGEPVIRAAVGRAMKEMGAQFVLGETIGGAIKRAAATEARGYTYSYDMLGEAARTEADARRYHLAYSRAITAIAGAARGNDIRTNPGISVKLSALHCRYDPLQREAVMRDLVPRLRSLCDLACSAGIGLNIDAEEADRLSLSLDVIAAVLADPALAGWDGFGVVVQAYGPRAGHVIDWLHDLAARLDRRIMVRLVKGAYWDTEIKRAQVAGVDGFPVFTSKAATDVSYLANARRLLGMTDRIYPQFATHNAHTVAAVLHMAETMGIDPSDFEFQRLHGMGETLHGLVQARAGTRCRIYAPVGAHRDLLAYLVRRLLENGANSSFVNQIVAADIPPRTVAADPFAALDTPARALCRGPALFEPERPNARGFDLRHAPTLAAIDAARAGFAAHRWQARPLLACAVTGGGTSACINPARPDDSPGQVTWAAPADVAAAARAALPWRASPAARARVLNRAADLFETHHAELFALLHREAGKTLPDAVAELREAVDFLRYYAARSDGPPALGVFACISPWNFPLAIFTGQVSAALAAGNAVLAKPAEQTPLIACRATELLHEAGVPVTALQLLPGAGDIGAELTRAPQVAGVAFTGATETAQAIHRAMAAHLAPGAPLIAETGGLNAMIVDSTALPEQVVQAVIDSAFQSAGQRCSALRCLYVQQDIAPALIEMLKGAMDALTTGDPWRADSDIGPVIDPEAQAEILGYVAHAEAEGRVLHRCAAPRSGCFVAPVLIGVAGIQDLKREVFGPVLHVATFQGTQIDAVIDRINATGYGLTFGLQTRIDDRVQHVSERVQAGNIYVNRNQIGAIVGSQPFGGEGLSGTGPKAGGPLYLGRFRAVAATVAVPVAEERRFDRPATVAEVQRLLTRAAASGTRSGRCKLPGPTGEANLYETFARAPVLCLGPGHEAAEAQAQALRDLGGVACPVPGDLAPGALEQLSGFSAALWWGDADTAGAYRQALARRAGPILTLVTGSPDAGHARGERHICIDTTASGGNAELLAGRGGAG